MSEDNKGLMKEQVARFRKLAAMKPLAESLMPEMEMEEGADEPTAAMEEGPGDEAELELPPAGDMGDEMGAEDEAPADDRAMGDADGGLLAGPHHARENQGRHGDHHARRHSLHRGGRSHHAH